MDAVRFVKALENVKRVNEEFNRTVEALFNNQKSMSNSYIHQNDNRISLDQRNVILQ